MYIQKVKGVVIKFYLYMDYPKLQLAKAKPGFPLLYKKVEMNLKIKK